MQKQVTNMCYEIAEDVFKDQGDCSSTPFEILGIIHIIFNVSSFRKPSMQQIRNLESEDQVV